MDADSKKAACARLRRIAGQVQAVGRMVEADRYCIELMHQLDAVQAGLGKVGEVVLRSHLQTCVTEATVSARTSVILLSRSAKTQSSAPPRAPQ